MADQPDQFDPQDELLREAADESSTESDDSLRGEGGGTGITIPIRRFTEDPELQPDKTTRQQESGRIERERMERIQRDQDGEQQARVRRDKAEDEIKERLKPSLGRGAKSGVAAAEKKGVQAVERQAVRAAGTKVAEGVAIRAAGLATGVGEVLLAFDAVRLSLGFLKKYRWVIALIVAGIIFGVLILIGAIGAAAGSPEAAGTSQVQPVQPSSAQQIDTIKAMLAGGKLGKNEAERILAATATIRTSGGNTAATLALLEEIDTAAKEIIAKPDDATVVTAQTKIIKDRLNRLATLLAPASGCGGISPCLDVPAVAEGRASLCGVTSTVMLILYYNPSYDDDRYYDQSQSYGRAAGGVPRTNPGAGTGCVAEAYISRNINNPAKDDWTRRNYLRVSGGKDGLIGIIKNSLAGGDPVIFFSTRDAIFSGSQHIFVVVGYDATDSPDKGGTFIINNPDIGKVEKQVKASQFGNKKKLTAEHLKAHMGGDGQYGYNNTIIVRSVYSP